MPLPKYLYAHNIYIFYYFFIFFYYIFLIYAPTFLRTYPSQSPTPLSNIASVNIRPNQRVWLSHPTLMCLFYIGVSMPDWYRDTCPTHRTYPSQSPIIQWSSKHSFISLSSGFVLIIKHSLSEWFCLLWASHTGYFGFLRPTLHIDWYSRIIGIFSE